MKNQKDSAEELKLFVLKLMSEEQDTHSQNLETLKRALGTTFGKKATKILNELYRAKIEVLDKVLDKIQKL
jgi:hypothetical protein